jgi:cysteine desulfurase/selenocysteine lyase
LIDGAQASSHIKVDVHALDVDYYTTSAHKMCGPTGVGMLYGKKELLEALPAYQGGGEMIKEVYFEGTTYAGLPHKFEAGTPNIAGGIAFGAAIKYLNSIGLDAIATHEDELLQYATAGLKDIDDLIIYGDVPDKTAVISFNINGLHPYDVGTLLDQMGIAVRTGQHCAQPVMDFYGIPGTVRASFAFYNTKEEIDLLISGVRRAVSMLL